VEEVKVLLLQIDNLLLQIQKKNALIINEKYNKSNSNNKKVPKQKYLMYILVKDQTIIILKKHLNMIQ